MTPIYGRAMCNGLITADVTPRYTFRFFAQKCNGLSKRDVTHYVNVLQSK